jgi:hypothetical protein
MKPKTMHEFLNQQSPLTTLTKCEDCGKSVPTGEIIHSKIYVALDLCPQCHEAFMQEIEQEEGQRPTI